MHGKHLSKHLRISLSVGDAPEKGILEHWLCLSEGQVGGSHLKTPLCQKNGGKVAHTIFTAISLLFPLEYTVESL